MEVINDGRFRFFVEGHHGSGKGIIANALAEKYNCRIENINEETPEKTDHSVNENVVFVMDTDHMNYSRVFNLAKQFNAPQIISVALYRHSVDKR